MQRSHPGSAQDELADLRERHALLQSSGIDVDFSTRVDHLNDRRIARHQTWSKIGTQVSVGSTLEDQILAASAKDITQPQRQLLQLGVAQVRPTAAMGARVCVSSRIYQLLLLDLCWYLNRRLDLSVPQDNILELRSWLAHFRTPDRGESESQLRAFFHSLGFDATRTPYRSI